MFPRSSRAINLLTQHSAQIHLFPVPPAAPAAQAVAPVSPPFVIFVLTNSPCSGQTTAQPAPSSPSRQAQGHESSCSHPSPPLLCQVRRCLKLLHQALLINVVYIPNPHLFSVCVTCFSPCCLLPLSLAITPSRPLKGQQKGRSAATTPCAERHPTLPSSLHGLM